MPMPTVQLVEDEPDPVQRKEFDPNDVAIFVIGVLLALVLGGLMIWLDYTTADAAQRL
jgi:hypothetical protein